MIFEKKRSIQIPNRLVGWTIGLVIVIFTTLQSYQIFRRPMLGTVDTAIYGSHLNKYVWPELYTHDIGIEAADFPKYYPALYLWTMSGLMRLTGSFETASALLSPIVYIIYLSGMVTLLRRSNVRWFIALPVALFSTTPFMNISGPWGFQYLNTAVARNWYMAGLPWLILLAHPWLIADVQDRPFYAIVPLGLMTGLAANLHPSSGLIMIQIISLLIVLRYLRHEFNWKHLAFFWFTILIGVIPIVLTLLSTQTPDADAVISFDRLVELVKIRVGYKFPYPTIMILGQHCGERCQIGFVWSYLTLMIGCAAAMLWARRKLMDNLARWMLGIVALLQLFMLWVLGTDLKLLIPAALYLGFNLVLDQIDKQDKRMLEFIAAALLLGFVGGYIVDWLWRTMRAYPLTSFALEQGRAIRFGYFPIFVFIAFSLNRLWSRWKEHGIRLSTFLIVTTALLVFSLPGMSDTWFALALATIIINELWVYWKTHAGWLDNALYSLQVGSLIALVAQMSITLILLDKSFSLLALLLGGLGGGAIFLEKVFLEKAEKKTLIAQFIKLTAGGIALALIFLFPGNNAKRATLVAATSQLPETLSAHWSPTRTTTHAHLQTYELSQWARLNTPTDSLFYSDNVRFRFWSRRSIFASFYEIGIANIRTFSPIDLYGRLNTYEEGFENPDLMQQLVTEYEIDYVIVDRQLYEEWSCACDWPVVYQDNLYTVYATPFAETKN